MPMIRLSTFTVVYIKSSPISKMTLLALDLLQAALAPRHDPKIVTVQNMSKRRWPPDWFVLLSHVNELPKLQRCRHEHTVGCVSVAQAGGGIRLQRSSTHIMQCSASFNESGHDRLSTVGMNHTKDEFGDIPLSSRGRGVPLAAWKHHPSPIIVMLLPTSIALPLPSLKC